MYLFSFVYVAVYYAIVTTDPKYSKTVDLERYPGKLGITMELCAGIVDKSKPLNEIAREEVIEECGYDVPIERLEELMTYRSGVGTSGKHSSSTIHFTCDLQIFVYSAQVLFKRSTTAK